VPPGEGRVQACLREQRPALSWECQEELFRQEVENADDLRLNVVLFRACGRDKAKFCADVRYGGARVKDCLEDHKDEAGFSAGCKTEFEAMMARRATDFRLDAQLRELCAADIDAVCGYEKDSLDSVAGHDGRVVECLQDYKAELKSAACRDRVHVLTARAAADIRMDRPLADACAADAQRLCADVEPGGARVLRCLQDHEDKLAYECRATLFDQEVRLAEDIDFQVPMKKACSREIGTLCAGVEPGEARVIQCLVEHDEDAGMGADCRAEVKRFEVRAGQDYRLQHRLAKACSSAVERLCPDACAPFAGQPCGGTVLACLVEHRDDVADDACSRELFAYEKTIANDERADAVLARACAGDVAAHCAAVEPGLGRVHDCLREHREQLSAACAAEELKMEELEADDVRLRPGFARDCGEEMAVYCRGVAPGKGRMFRCLQNALGQPEFSDACRARVADKQARSQLFYNLDYGVRTACAAEAAGMCADAGRTGHGKANVLKCLVAGLGGSGENKACQAEVGRALRMALWQYRRGAALTEACDADVDALCGGGGAGASDDAPGPVGSIGRCLARAAANATAAGAPSPLAAACGRLVEFAVPRDPHDLLADDVAATAALTARLAAAQAAAAAQLGAALVRPPAQGGAVTPFGWAALAFTAALALAVGAAGVLAFRKCMGWDRPYTLVVKGGDL
jgi:Golgi apparatus protein 1